MVGWGRLFRTQFSNTTIKGLHILHTAPAYNNPVPFYLTRRERVKPKKSIQTPFPKL